MLVCAAMLFAGWTGAHAGAVLLKGTVLSSRALRSSSTDHLMSVRLKVDAVLIGRWPARTAAVRLHMEHAVTSGTAIYVVLEGDGRSRHAVAWDYADHGVCLTPAQQAEYSIDPAALPVEERCNPE